MDRLSALRLFVRAVETASFSRAARDSGLSQPAVSRAVAALEADLGARLLQRTTRRLALTEAGQRVYVQSLRLLAEEEALVEAVAGADREPVGRLRISTSVAFAATEIAPHVEGFLARYPRMRLDVVATDARIDPVAEGVDLIFRLGDLSDSGMTGRRLGAYPRWLVAAPAVAARLPVDLAPAEQLAGRCIVFSGSAQAGRWRLTHADGATDFEATGAVTTTNGAVVQSLAAAGAGVALMPSFAIREDLERGRLVRVLPGWQGSPLDVHALWTHRELPRKARVWLDWLAPRLALEDR
jgi:DNA-binding transcriptional LysR family regulator